MAAERVLRVAIVGAESTGKTTLAQWLVQALQAHGVAAAWVPEVLRTWCDAHQRTPKRDEQRGIAEEQSRLVFACDTVDVCISDTTALMTAVYSACVLQDCSLYTWAAAEHALFDLTLLTDTDIPWRADGLHRDGPHLREPVDTALRAALQRHQLPFTVITGHGDAREKVALARVLAALSVRGISTG